MRFVIVGMNNPQGNQPLWPDPPGCAGHRLWQMATARTGVTVDEWLEMTDRRNLCQGEWDRELGRAQARRWTQELWTKTTVLLGEEVASCFPSTGLLCQWAKPMGTPPRSAPPWVHIPHPSGMNREYNDPKMKAGVEILLGDLVELARGRKAA